jgi:type I site-specific restriction-modification system R (restriction) subunit
MQAIARVNRVYENAKEGKIKEYGLIVDYNNIWNPLLQALAQYGDEDANDEFSLDEVTLAKQKLLDFLAILNESFVLDILNVDKTDKIKIYQFVIKNAELITDLDKDKKSKFLTIVQNVNRYFKICFNQIDRNIKETISIVNIIKQLIIQREISCDENLELSKNKLIELINSAFKDPTTSVTVLSKTFKKDITTVTDILKETDDLSKISPKASIEFIKNWLRKEIDLILNKRP